MPTAKTPDLKKLHINATAGEVAAWRKRASWEGYSLSGWIRVVLAEASGINPPNLRQKRKRVPLSKRLEEQSRLGEYLLEQLRAGQSLQETAAHPEPPPQDLPAES